MRTMWTTLRVHISVQKECHGHSINNRLPNQLEGRKNFQRKYSTSTATKHNLQHGTAGSSAESTTKVQPDIGFSGGRLGFVVVCLFRCLRLLVCLPVLRDFIFVRKDFDNVRSFLPLLLSRLLARVDPPR